MYICICIYIHILIIIIIVPPRCVFFGVAIRPPPQYKKRSPAGLVLMNPNKSGRAKKKSQNRQNKTP